MSFQCSIINFSSLSDHLHPQTNPPILIKKDSIFAMKKKIKFLQQTYFKYTKNQTINLLIQHKRIVLAPKIGKIFTWTEKKRELLLCKDAIFTSMGTQLVSNFEPKKKEIENRLCTFERSRVFRVAEGIRYPCRARVRQRRRRRRRRSSSVGHTSYVSAGRTILQF